MCMGKIMAHKSKECTYWADLIPNFWSLIMLCDVVTCIIFFFPYSDFLILTCLVNLVFFCCYCCYFLSLTKLNVYYIQKYPCFKPVA